MKAELDVVGLEIEEAAQCLSMGQEEEAADHLARAAKILEQCSSPMGSARATPQEPHTKKNAA